MNRLEDFRLWEYTSLRCFLHQSLPWWSYQQLRRDPLCGLRFMLTKCRFRQSPIPPSQVSVVFFRGRKWQSNASYLRSEYGFICSLLRSSFRFTSLCLFLMRSEARISSHSLPDVSRPFFNIAFT